MDKSKIERNLTNNQANLTSKTYNERRSSVLLNELKII